MFTAFAPLLAAVALSFGDPEVFALMLLAFATFVGLGGDDIPKTIFSICIGLVLATVGFDIVSGEPRLIFLILPGFRTVYGFLCSLLAFTVLVRCSGPSIHRGMVHQCPMLM
jgi:putative tricarboxylic transport membrane protein